jgi:hypothetical protein
MRAKEHDVTTTVRSIKNRRREAERRAMELEAKILEWAERIVAGMRLAKTLPGYTFRIGMWQRAGPAMDDILSVASDMRAAVASPWPREETPSNDYDLLRKFRFAVREMIRNAGPLDDWNQEPTEGMYFALLRLEALVEAE